MARQLRINYPGAFYHVTSRGNEQKAVFKSKRDREKFLEYLETATLRYNAVVHVYCLMDNHYHLLVETPRANISKGMHLLNTRYCIRFNRRHERVGHVLQGRFKSLLVDRHSYLLELSRYIVLNPVKAGLVKRPEDWEWSSYRAAIGLEGVPDFLRTEHILEMFSPDIQEARKLYREFVMDGLSRLGMERDEEVLEKGKRYTKAILKELEKARRKAGHKKNALKSPKTKRLLREIRKDLILKSVIELGLKPGEAAAVLGIHRSTIYRMVNKCKSDKKK